MTNRAQPPSDSTGDHASDHHPELQRYIAAARKQPPIATRVSADAVLAGVEAQRRRTQTRRTLLFSAAVAIAASLLAAIVLWPILSAREQPRDQPQRAGSSVAAQPSKLPGPASSEHAVEPASAIRMRSTAPVEVLGPWSIALHEGTHEIELESGDQHVLTVALPGRTLELASLESIGARMTVEFVDGDAAVRLRTGVAAWIGVDGQRTEISVEHFEQATSEIASETTSQFEASRDSGPSAAELARAAEQALAAGQREQAIAHYRQLVRKHPRASQTRAAVLDLARLLRVSGEADEARCAYRLYLERWPQSSVRAEVESQLERLGEGPRCRSLNPIR